MVTCNVNSSRFSIYFIENRYTYDIFFLSALSYKNKTERKKSLFNFLDQNNFKWNSNLKKVYTIRIPDQTIGKGKTGKFSFKINEQWNGKLSEALIL